jgi:16S rRNA (cytosine1402-N4)-methyltransferase
MIMSTTQHIPVMLAEVLDALDVRVGGRYVDCTLGGAGHAEAILERSQPGGTLVGIDADPAAIARGEARLARFDGAFRLVQGNFRQVGEICRQMEFAPVHGVLMDLGLSSFQLDEGEGFSFKRETPLDMRFGGTSLTAEDIVNNYSEAELADLIFKYGEDPASRRIARSIVAARPVRTTAQLAKAVEQAVGRRANM